MPVICLLLILTAIPLSAAQDGAITGSVTGVVLDAERRPLPGATVYGLPEKDMRKQFRTTTDAAGEFTLSNIPAGYVYLHAFKEHDGYPYDFFSFFWNGE